ncbi:MAG: PhzF family phenazine biosynthesis protein, partial [Chitinophagaceae bacterium]
MVEQLSTEKLSKSTFMQVFRAKAFTSAKQIDGKDFIGNPASVVICNHHLPSNEEMRKIAISEKSPMTAFVLHQSGKQFQIRFFTPAGEEFGLCGHATLVAAHFIYQLYGLEEASFFKKEQLIIQSKKSNHGFKVRLPAFESESLENAISKVYLEDFGLLPTDLEAAYYCKKINDVFLILKS